MNAHAEEANEILLRLILGRAKDIVHAVLLEFERSLEDGS
jgi:hypothetical protein